MDLRLCYFNSAAGREDIPSCGPDAAFLAGGDSHAGFRLRPGKLVVMIRRNVEIVLLVWTTMSRMVLKSPYG